MKKAVKTGKFDGYCATCDLPMMDSDKTCPHCGKRRNKEKESHERKDNARQW